MKQKPKWRPSSSFRLQLPKLQRVPKRAQPDSRFRDFSLQSKRPVKHHAPLSFTKAKIKQTNKQNQSKKAQPKFWLQLPKLQRLRKRLKPDSRFPDFSLKSKRPIKHHAPLSFTKPLIKQTNKQQLQINKQQQQRNKHWQQTKLQQTNNQTEALENVVVRPWWDLKTNPCDLEDYPAYCLTFF